MCKGIQIPVLNHGFVKLIDYMGTDSSIVQAARVSYGKGTEKTSKDTGLIRYLMRNRHTSPFEMCEVQLHIKLPIFVARQWVRHRTASINEISGRYSVLREEFYEPVEWCEQSTSNKQGAGKSLSSEKQFTTGTHYSLVLQRCKNSYRSFIRNNVAREQARIALPLSTYTEWYWKIDLHNLLHFLKLRQDSHAQYEIRQYANVIAGIVEQLYPITFKAFQDYIINSITFSTIEIALLKDICPALSDIATATTISDITTKYKMTSSEYKEFINKLRKFKND